METWKFSYISQEFNNMIAYFLLIFVLWTLRKVCQSFLKMHAVGSEGK